MKKYNRPEISIVSLSHKDVICTSQTRLAQGEYGMEDGFADALNLS